MNVPFLQDTTFTGLISTKSYGTSQEWSQAYSLIQTNSANWEESAEILPTVTNYLSTNNVLVSTLNTRGQLLSAGTDLFDIFLTSETDSQTLTYTPSSYLLSISNGNIVNLSSINTTFANNSGKYESVYSSVANTSANWNSAYQSTTALNLSAGLWNESYKASTAYQKVSSSFATTSYVNDNFLPLSGGLVQGPVQINNNLTVFGNLTASGTTTFANTVFTTTSSLSVVHLGSGPALYVGNFGDDHIATFVDLQNNLEMLHIGGLSSSFPNVGVKTGYPNKDFTVRGEISASGTIWNSEGNSTQWNTAYINVSSQSLNIDSNVQFNQVSAGAIVTSSNSKLDLVGFGPNTAYLTTTPDDTTALFMGVFGAEVRANTYFSITTNTGDVSRLWLFGTDGSLSFPDGSTQTTAFTGNPDSQTLTFTQSSVQLSITNGNTVSLSALDDKEFATAMAIALS